MQHSVNNGFVSAGAICVTMGLGGTEVLAQGDGRTLVRIWDNPAGGSFLKGSNWDDGIAPDGNDSAYFELDAAPYRVFLTDMVSLNQVRIGPGTVRLDTRGYRLSSNVQILVGIPRGAAGGLLLRGLDTWIHGNISVGSSTGISTLVVEDGAFIDGGSLSVCESSTQPAEAIIQGHDSRYLAPVDTLMIGQSGPGRVTIRDGAQAVVGKVEMTDTWTGSFESAYLHVSNASLSVSGDFRGHDQSTIVIESGAEVDCGSATIEGVNCALAISGPGTSVHGRKLQVGPGGSAYGVIDQGAQVRVEVVQSWSDLLITHEGTELAADVMSILGEKNDATMRFENGARGRTPLATIGSNSTFDSSLIIDGIGTRLDIVPNEDGVPGTMRVSRNLNDPDAAHILLRNGGLLCGGRINVATNLVIEGEVVIGGCTTRSNPLAGFAPDALEIADGARPALSDGRIEVVDSGELAGGGFVPASVVNSGGAVRANDWRQPLVIEGDYEQRAGGQAEARMIGAQPEDVCQIVVEGDAQIDGALVGKVAPTARVNSGHTVRVLSARAIQGGFTSARLDRPNGVHLEVLNGLTEIRVRTCVGMRLHSTHLHNGEGAKVVVTGAKPGAPVWLYASLHRGVWEDAEHDVLLDLHEAERVSAAAMADAHGTAVFFGRAPDAEDNPFVYLQAVQMQDASNTIRKQLGFDW